MRSKKSKILAIILTMCLIFSTFSGLGISASAETAIAKIQRFAANDDATGLTVDDLTAAGVTASSALSANIGVHAALMSNSTGYIGAIERATYDGVESSAKIQILVDGVNLATAISYIENYVLADPDLTIADLTAAGVNGAIAVNLTLYEARIIAAINGSLDTSAKIQGVINTVNGEESVTAINTIKAYALANNAGGLDEIQLAKAGVVNIIVGNLQAYKDAIVALADDATLLNETGKIQALVTSVNASEKARKEAAAINLIKSYAANDNAQALSQTTLEEAGILRYDALNLGVHAPAMADSTCYIGAIERATPSQVDESSKIQIIIDNVNAVEKQKRDDKAAALLAISIFAANDNASGLTLDMLAKAGVTGAMQVNIGTHGTPSTGYILKIEQTTALLSDETSEIQAFINTVNTDEKATAITTITNYVSGDALTIALLTKAGVATTGVTAATEANLPAYKSVIGTATPAQTATDALIQGYITNANAAIVAIEAMTTGSTSLTEQMLTNAGIAFTTGRLVEYQAAINAAAVGAANTFGAIQSIISSVNSSLFLTAAIGVIDGYNNANNAAGMTTTQLTDAGAVIKDANIAAYRLAIAAATDHSLTSKESIQAIINAIDAQEIIVAKISGFAANDDARELDIPMLLAAGVTEASAKLVNLDAYRTEIAAKTANVVTTKLEIQNIIDAVNTSVQTAAVNAIAAYTEGAAGLTIAQLIAAGVTITIDSNLDAYKVAIGADATIATQAQIINTVQLVNDQQSAATLLKIREYAANDNALALTMAELDKALLANLNQYNLDAYKVNIAAAVITANFQTVINTTNDQQSVIAINAIKSYAANDNASALSIPQLTIALLNPGAIIIAANLSAYQTAIANAASTDVDTAGKITTIVTNTNTEVSRASAINVIKAYAANDNAAALATAQLTAIDGLLNVNGANLESYKVAIANASSAEVDTLAEIQALITKVNNAVIAITNISGYAAGAAALTINELIAAGATGTIVANLPSYKTAIGSAPANTRNTTAGIQTIVNTVNQAVIDAAVLVIKVYAANDDATALTIDQLVTAGITNLVAANLGENPDDTLHPGVPSTGYILAIEQATAAGADSTGEIQIIINNVNTLLSSSVISGVSIGSIQGSIPTGSSDPLFVPTINVTIPSTTTAFLATNLIATGSGVVSLYTSSDFTGLIGSAGVAITANTSTITVFAKVVSANGLSTRYYKIVLTVVDVAKKYEATSTAFVQEGAYYTATVTIDRGQAAALADAKILLIYTLADGESMFYLTQNAVVGANDIVVDATVSSVTVVLVDGRIDWSKGIPKSKSNGIMLTVPVL